MSDVRREHEARLIWQIYCGKAVDAGGGKFPVWEYLPDREAFIEAVSVVFNDRYRNIVAGLADRLYVPVPERGYGAVAAGRVPLPQTEKETT